MAINSFHTLFDARERKFQSEKLFQGEAVDLVARITNDGVLQDLTGYSVTGYYQPSSYAGTDEQSVFYSVDAEISGSEVKVHWTPDKDFGHPAYTIWALLQKSGTEQAYPVAWKINLAHSPGYPPGETPEPIPQTIDFNDYELLNAPWLPLAGGTVTGNVSVTTNLTVLGTATAGNLNVIGNETVNTNLTVGNKFKSKDITVNDTSSTQVFIGSHAGKADGAVAGAVAIGYNAKTNPFGTAVGTGADVDANGDVAFGFGAKGTGNFGTALGRGTTATGDMSIAVGHNAAASGGGSMAFGYGTNATANNAIQIGSYTDGTGTFPSYNRTANSVQIFQHQVFQTTGTPTSDPNSSNLVLVKERAPWAVRKNELIDFLATDWSGNPDMSKVSLFDIAQRVNQCVAAINGKSIPKADLPTGEVNTHIFLTDGTDVEFSGTSIEEGTIDTFLKGQGHAEGSHLVRSVVLGSAVTTIDHHAFSGYWFPELVSVDLSRSPATTLGSRAFFESPKVNYVNIGPNITTIEVSCFSQCPQLKSLTIPATVTSLPSYLADNSGQEKLTITWQGRTKAQVQALTNYSFHTPATYVATDETWTIS